MDQTILPDIWVSAQYLQYSSNDLQVSLELFGGILERIVICAASISTRHGSSRVPGGGGALLTRFELCFPGSMFSEDGRPACDEGVD